MIIGRTQNDLKWNYGLAMETNRLRGKGFIFAIWFFKLKERSTSADNSLKIDRGFYKSFSIF